MEFPSIDKYSILCVWGEIREKVVLICCACFSVPGKNVCHFILAKECIGRVYTGEGIPICSERQAGLRAFEALSITSKLA